MKSFVGCKTLEVSTKIIEDFKKHCIVSIPDKRINAYPNLYVELRSFEDEKKTALGYVSADKESIVKIEPQQVANIQAKNREQVFAIDALIRPEVTVVVLIGSAGTGKTIITLASALEHMERKRFSKVILTRPMSEVGKYKLGALPGDASEKFNPYLLNYMTNLEQFVGKNIVNDLIQQSKFEITPLQLVRGASFSKSMVIADEMQVCTPQEILTIGTRIGEDSKIVIMGDLNQRDEKIAKDKTGLYKLMNDRMIKESPLVATIKLEKCERSPTAKLFAEVFED